MAKNRELLLSDLLPGQKGTIVKFTTEDIFLKLMEMGCLPGESIEVVKIAPFRDPISVSIAGYMLSLRIDEAQHVVVSITI
jgi:ferrous iron transport protein A